MCAAETPGDEEESAPYEEFFAWLRRLRRRTLGAKPELTPADIVPPGAEPICPSCVLPHHPLEARCPHCNEIVTPYATIMPFVWIHVWGPRLQRVVYAKRLSPLLRWGLLVSAIGFLSDACCYSLWSFLFVGPFPTYVPMWLIRLFSVGNSLALGVPYAIAGLRMIEAAARGRAADAED